MLHDLVFQDESLICASLARFISREREISEVNKLLVTSRLLTLTGPGGCGKTTLAFQMACSQRERFKQGVWWVELEALANPALLPQVVSKVLGMGEPLGKSLIDTLVDFLRSKHLLLVLDNCEHIVVACAHLAEILLRACPYLQMLTTSREVLRIAEETAWLVPFLRVPDLRFLPSLEELRQYEAVQLFVERATAVLPSFVLTLENMGTVAQICSRLDGLPLAIEMAATRVKVLSIEQIAMRLRHPCRLLTTGSRTALPRQQTLQAMIDWSYDLLSEQERIIFRRMSVFATSCTLDAVGAICADEYVREEEVLDLLSSLVDKSLVIVEEHNGEKQYRILETMRQYGQEKLQEQAEGELVYKRHQNWCLGVVGQKLAEKEHSDDAALYGKHEQGEIETVAQLEGILNQHFVKVKALSVMKQPELCLFALGSGQVYRGKYALTPSDWTYAKAKELLFYLLCHHSRTKEQIGLALWPDASSTQLRNNLHSTLYHLRRALGRSEWIIFEHGRYAFNRQLAYQFDIEAFEAHLAQTRKLQTQEPAQAIQALEEAVKLYQGDFLEDMLDSNWSLRRQKELRQMFLNALLTLGQLLFSEKQYGKATHTYCQLIAHDSYQEVAHRELMRCYAYQDERSQALRHYQDLVVMLHQELGSTPATETTALFERLHRGEEP